MIKIEKYNQEKHYDRIQSFCKSWGHPMVEAELLPKTGFVSESAALFIINTDMDFCILEFFLSSRDNENRESHCSEILRACLNEAQRLGYKKVHGFTENPKLKDNIPKDFGFKSSGVYELLTKGF